MNTCPYESRDDSRPCQCAVYRNISVSIATPTPITGGLEMAEWEFPYAVAMSQDCDLSEDHKAREQRHKGDLEKNHDKFLRAVLMCPAYMATPFRDGTHLECLGFAMEKQNSDKYRAIKRNQNPRYHFLAAWTPLQVPELVIDFKHFFTIPTELLRYNYGTEQHHIARLKCPYREDLSHRFTAYLSRVGLPIPHHVVGPSDSSTATSQQRAE